MGSDGSTVGRTGTAVLVHGGWGHPADWTWVKDELRSAGVHVLTPDLPSHQSGVASFADDVETVRDAVRASSAPVVLVGWSYGGDVIGVAAAGEDSVVHLVYVAAVPALAEVEPRDTSWADNDPHILVGEDGSFGLDNAWWLEAEGERLFAGAVLEHATTSSIPRLGVRSPHCSSLADHPDHRVDRAPRHVHLAQGPSMAGCPP
jgi:pimeloyl-ACP methyl ester carboxylesterase